MPERPVAHASGRAPCAKGLGLAQTSSATHADDKGFSDGPGDAGPAPVTEETVVRVYVSGQSHKTEVRQQELVNECYEDNQGVRAGQRDDGGPIAPRVGAARARRSHRAALEMAIAAMRPATRRAVDSLKA